MTGYDDIIELSRPESAHPKMSRHDRAAQFSPFAALTGYGDAVEETARITDSKLEPDDDRKADINEKLRFIADNIYDMPSVKIIYFVKDEKKQGGKYVIAGGEVRMIDEYEQAVIFKDGRKIYIDDIYEITLVDDANNKNDD